MQSRMNTVDDGRHTNRGVPIAASHSRESTISSVDGPAAITRVILER
ncbi:hypothetical protein [Natronorubrum sp. A-ect3]